MSEQRDLHIALGGSYPGGPSADYPEEAGFEFARAPNEAMGSATAPMSRLTRSTLMIAIFFCGWAILRVGEINLTLSDLLLFAVMAAMLVRGQINIRPFGNLTIFWLLGLGLMLFGLLIGSLINGSVDRWLIVGGQYLFAFLAIPMILMGQQDSLTRSLPALFVIGIAISQLIGISASLILDLNDVVDALGNGFLTGNGRVGAMTGEPNSNGAMIAFSLPMLLYSVRRGVMPPGIALLCGILLVWGTLASGSFTGFVAALIALGVYLAISGFGWFVRASLVGAIALSLFLASGIPLPAAFEERVVGALATGDLNQAGTFTGRSELIQEAWQMADDSMLVGLGVDQFRVVSTHGAPVHELHLLIWNEGGVVAFAGLAMLLLTMVAAALIAISRSRPEGAMILAVVVVFNVYTFSIPHMYSREWILPVLLAMSAFFARRPAFYPTPDQVGLHR